MTPLHPRRRRRIELCLEAAAALRDPRRAPDRIVAALVVALTDESDRVRPARRPPWWTTWRRLFRSEAAT